MIKINLLKQVKGGVSLQKVTIYKQLAIGGVAVLAILAILIFMEYTIHSQISMTQNNMTRLNQKLVQLNKEVKEIKNFKKMKIQIKSKLDVITTLGKNRAAEVHLMDELSKSIPINPANVLSKKLWLLSLAQHGNLVQIKGIALDNSTIAQFMDNLSRNPYFSNVNLANTVQRKSKDLLLYRFSLNYKFNSSPNAKRKIK